MTIASKLSGEAFEAALKKEVRRDSHHSLNKCQNAMRRVLTRLEIDPAEVTNDLPTYMALRDRVTDYAQTL